MLMTWLIGQSPTFARSLHYNHRDCLLIWITWKTPISSLYAEQTRKMSYSLFASSMLANLLCIENIFIICKNINITWTIIPPLRIMLEINVFDNARSFSEYLQANR